LLQRNFAVADSWSERIRAKQPGPHLFVRLGQFHEVARQNQKAANFYNEALAAGFYPEGLLGLARLEAHAKNKEQAKRHLMAALDAARPLGQKAVGPLPLFHRITGQLLSLEDPVPNCRAWVASMNGGKSPPGLANKSILIYAPGRHQAEQFLNEIVGAMEPGTPPIAAANIGWREAEKEKQPDGPVRPGV
jgi:tetratricopeptide (TPR) repeat protein